MRFNAILFLFFFWNLTLLAQYKLTLEKLPESINSPLYDEIGPILSYDGQTMYFTKVGNPEFDKTLEIDGKNLYLSLSQVQYDNFLAKIYTQIAGFKIRNAIRSDYNQDVWIAQFDKNFLIDVENGPRRSSPL